MRTVLAVFAALCIGVFVAGCKSACSTETTTYKTERTIKKQVVEPGDSPTPVGSKSESVVTTKQERVIDRKLVGE